MRIRLKETNSGKKVRYIVLTALLAVLVIVLICQRVIADREAAVALARSETIAAQHKEQEEHLARLGYVPLAQTMEASGYTRGADSDRGYTFYRRHANMEIQVFFDLKQGICEKNQYSFDLKEHLTELRDVWYIKEDKLDAITNADTRKWNYAKHPWTKGRLVAHAGGGFRDSDGGYISNYTNSLEAMVQNYNLGCRVFEFDFAPTTDGKLAAVHDWKNHAKRNGKAVSSEEWKKLNAVAKPLTEGRYTAIFAEDVLDQMLVNEDMFVVTDVKYDDMTEEKLRDQFEHLYAAAKKRDISILNRVVPQVYSQEMYDWLMEIYPFPSVIFTCYKTEASASEMIAFCAEKENIHVITTQYEALSDAADETGLRFTSKDIADLHEKGLLIYNHTISSWTKLYDCFSRGVDGIYSNNMLPQDIEVYEKCQ